MAATIRSVILLSGGLDSATVLAAASAAGHACYALTIDYGQRHLAELAAARALAARFAVREHRIARVDLGQFGGSALTDSSLAVPEAASAGIPATYVPARNTVMLAVALAWAEVLGAQEIHIGANAIDYSGYPDCRPPFIAAFNALARAATKAGLEGRAPIVQAPLMELGKPDILRWGTALGVDYGMTVSCYQADAEGRACGRCDACRLRAQGFVDAGLPDPTHYA
ncbi:MAG TPA: 7-cyano-7-deazaguanine synthase QueC [Gammaproteobacteria bacterium]|nr:7-cyano-7-deazaguanine synthase QueC [Gammaproteobacteria bacterium]